MDDTFRELIAKVVKHGPKEAVALKARAPGLEGGRLKRGQPGWRDPDVKVRGTKPPTGGVRGERF